LETLSAVEFEEAFLKGTRDSLREELEVFLAISRDGESFESFLLKLVLKKDLGEKLLKFITGSNKM